MKLLAQSHAQPAGQVILYTTRQHLETYTQLSCHPGAGRAFVNLHMFHANSGKDNEKD